MKPFITIQELKNLYAKNEITPQEVVAFFQERSKKYKGLNALIESFEITQDTYAQNTDGLLSNIPYLLKDNISQKGKICSAGSKILSSYKAPYSATVHQRLSDAGGISLGRTNMDEFAMGSSGEFSCYGNTLNPWNPEYTPGGSSSGSAAAVSAGLIPFALGTETGGSVRQPASFCNLVGLYPSYGLFSRYGIIPFASSTDQAGILTQTVYDNALVASTLAGFNERDSTSLQVKPKDYTQKLDGKIPDGLTLGILRDASSNEGMDPQVDAAFQAAVKQYETMGATVKEIKLPHLKYGIAVYFIISRAEAASNLSRYDGSLYGERNLKAQDLMHMYFDTRHDGFGVEVKRRILTGNYALSACHKGDFYNTAQHVRNMMRAEFLDAFKNVDLIIAPTTPTLPFKLGEMIDDPIAMYLADYFTVPNCVIGTPALSLPCGISKEGLPIGFQLMGPTLSEELIYQTAYAYEQSTDYHLKNPIGYE